jgi:hypothetical protein
LYYVLDGAEREELEKVASDYDNFEEELEAKYHPHFCEAGDNTCEKKCSYGPGQQYDEVFESGCLKDADFQKLRMLKQALARYLGQVLAQYHCTREWNGYVFW